MDPDLAGEPVTRAQLTQVLRKQVVDHVALRRKHRNQRVMGGLCDRCIDRGARPAAMQSGVAAIAASDRVCRVEHGDMDDRHGAARAPGPELLAEFPVFAGSRRRVVQAAGVDRDLVPVPQGIDRGGSLPDRCNAG